MSELEVPSLDIVTQLLKAQPSAGSISVAAVTPTAAFANNTAADQPVIVPPTDGSLIGAGFQGYILPLPYMTGEEFATLDEAVAAAIESHPNAGGITYDSDTRKYSLRASRTLLRGDAGDKSWLLYTGENTINSGGNLEETRSETRSVDRTAMNRSFSSDHDQLEGLFGDALGGDAGEGEEDEEGSQWSTEEESETSSRDPDLPAVRPQQRRLRPLTATPSPRRHPSPQRTQSSANVMAETRDPASLPTSHLTCEKCAKHISAQPLGMWSKYH